MGIDLSIIWFVIIVFATLMYIVMDGFDLGIGILFPATQNADDRDVMVNSVAPVWDGNETWLVLGGAALFGAFPLAYAVIIDALTIPLTLMLIGLIFRGVAFEFRFKATPAHRPFWDKAFIGGSILATFTQGVTVGRSSMGLPLQNVRIAAGHLTGLPRLTCSAARAWWWPTRCWGLRGW
jgi:cytochrome d ubiquinol oxidase subunit II